MERGSITEPLQMEWVFVSCATEHNASAVRVKCSQAAPRARSLPAVCRCKPMHTFAPYHDTGRPSSEKAQNTYKSHDNVFRAVSSVVEHLVYTAAQRVFSFVLI